MARIIFTIMITAMAAISLENLIENGMWLWLAGAIFSSFGYGLLAMRLVVEADDKNKKGW